MDNKTQFNLINTNARSLRPKIASFIRCFANLTLTLAIISETWLAGGSRLEREAEDLLLGQGLAVNYLNRAPSTNGVAHGGVAVISRNSCTGVTPFLFPNPEAFEVLPLQLKEFSIARRFFVIAAYIPPGYAVPRGKACLEHIRNIVLHIKNTSQDPYILVAGDFNQWDISGALADYPDIMEVVTPPTRLDRHIDKMFLNWHDEVTESGCIPPLESDQVGGSITYSDHRVQYACARLQRRDPVRWETFTYRPFTNAGADGFVAEISSVDWSGVCGQPDANAKATSLQHIIDDANTRHFPLKTIRRKKGDLPWIDSRAMKMINKKKAVYKAEGNSDRWKALRDSLDGYLARRQDAYLERQRDKMTGPDAASHFFKNVKAYSTHEKPRSFDVRELCPGKTDGETAAEVAEFFNRISAEFTPLEPADIPATYHRELRMLSPAEVAEMVRKSRKTASGVPGDVFPKLLDRCAESLSVPLASIFNEILTHYVWPVDWKREFVTVIPKKSDPTSFADLRNISCTKAFSKIFEQHVLSCLKEEVGLKSNQYGGEKGCSTTHMIIELMQQICENAEDYRSATVLCAVDYAKAFNRLSFQHCLEAFRVKGASSPIIRLIATFLTNRTMTVRVGDVWSEPLELSGGCPQGSILGVRLFNTATDDLENSFLITEHARLGLPAPDGVSLNIPHPLMELPTWQPPTSSSPRLGANLPFDPDVSPIASGVYGPESQHIIFRPRVRNAPALVRELEPPEERGVGTQVLSLKPVKVFKYVDDNITCEKTNFGLIPITDSPDGPVKLKHVVPTQNAFHSITGRAIEKGMVVNTDKTKLLCISDALNYTPLVYFFDAAGNRIESGKELKVLGFTFSNKPTVSLHLDLTSKKIRQRYWSLRHLRRVGFNDDELVKVYTSSIRPLAEYCCPAFHSMMTDEQDQMLENAQVGALRAIFGYGMSARRLRQQAQVDTLRQRRIELTDRFARKAANSPRFAHWFPRNQGGRNVRSREEFKELFAKTDRLKNSPLYYMRRRLNGKEGKVYGKRNEQYIENLALT